MNSREKWLAAGLAVSLAVNLVTAFALGTYWYEAKGRRARPAARPEPKTKLKLDRLGEKIDLSAEQLDSVRALREYRHQNIRPVRDRLDSLQQQLVAALQQPGLDQARVESLHRGIAAARESVEGASLTVLLRLRRILTPQQLEQLPTLFEDLQKPARKERPGKQRGPRAERREPRRGPEGRKGR